jgi:cytochrome c-type biogenesis protein
MDSYLVAVGSALWLGILTSISPCPLATNIAAITYIGQRVDRPAKVILSGLLYTVGRMATYVLLGVLVVASVLSIPDVAMFLQKNMNKFLGPILVVVGLFLLRLINLRLPSVGASDKLQRRVDAWGIWGAGLMGLLFALSFCPVSAALFFGGLIPIAIEQESSILMPTVYGIGTALPVVAFALLIALGTRFVGQLFNRLTIFEKWARRITGVVFLAVGLYYVLVYLVGWQI